jgi:hypothetical protein
MGLIQDGDHHIADIRMTGRFMITLSMSRLSGVLCLVVSVIAKAILWQRMLPKLL